VTAELESIDISKVPELLRLAEEVRTTGEPRVLRRDREDIAVLMPIVQASPRRAGAAKAEASRPAPAAHEVARSRAGILAAAGSWKDIDAKALKEYVRERRQASSRRPVVL
jgi:hypothetical protein